MARVVINSWGSFGDLNPYLALGCALRDRGHDVRMALPSHFREHTERAGLTFVEGGLGMELDSPETIAKVEQILSSRNGARYIYRDLVMTPLRETYRALHDACDGADLLVSQMLGIAAPLLHERTGIRWVSTVLAPLSFGSGYEMVVPPPAPWIKQLESLGPGVGHFFARFMRRVSLRWTKPVAEFRKELGLPPGKHPIFEGQLEAPLVLAMFSRVLGEPQPDWPRNSHVTGQLRFDNTFGDTLDPRLRAFLDDGPAPVVFTLGSSAVHASGAFYDESIRAMTQLGARAVFLAGPETTARLAATLPASMLMLSEAPHSQLFPRAAAIVQPCGVGTLTTALAAGKPLLSVPFAHDQPDNAWRAERLGVSRTIYPSRYKSRRVAATLESLLTDARVAARAQEVAETIHAEDGPRTACDLIEAYLQHSPSH
jgi:rhamnosyltransferase subunit B